MKREIEIYKEYLECLKNDSDFFSSFYFRPTLNCDFTKYHDVLINGFNTKNVPSLYNKNELYVTYYNNKDNYVDHFDKFTYVLNYPSFLISSFIDSYNTKENYIYCNDVRFINLPLDKDAVKGISIPEHMINENINHLNAVNDLKILIDEYRYSEYISNISKYFNKNISGSLYETERRNLKKLYMDYYFKGYEEDAIYKALKEQKDTLGTNLYELINDYVDQLWGSKIGKIDIKLLDVINYINDDYLPIYEIQKSRVKKLN